jgi:hypothetical protein
VLPPPTPPPRRAAIDPTPPVERALVPTPIAAFAAPAPAPAASRAPAAKEAAPAALTALAAPAVPVPPATRAPRAIALVIASLGAVLLVGATWTKLRAPLATEPEHATPSAAASPDTAAPIASAPPTPAAPPAASPTDPNDDGHTETRPASRTQLRAGHPTIARRTPQPSEPAAPSEHAAAPGPAAPPEAIAPTTPTTPTAPPDPPPGHAAPPTAEARAEEAPPLDRAALEAALASATPAVAACFAEVDDRGGGRVAVTVAPSGRVTRAVVEIGPFVGTAIGGCVARAFRGVRVAPFAGDAVTAHRGFHSP